ncbi:MAG: hypothetical protein E7553_05265 [Ruminococcaceae bacterium]|nr:hypothetical protein [Oscillospiraceae bacterium]
MKKLVSLLLAVIMVCTLLPMTAFARNAYIQYDPTDDCRLNSISFTQADNPWLLWDVTFAEADGETVLKTEKDHPNLVSAKVIPAIDFTGTSATFNGETIVAGEAVTLKAENEIVISDAVNHNFAEYTLLVTEKTNGLPVVLIDTDGAAIDTKLTYTKAYISVIGADIYGADDIYYGNATKDGIKLRGNSTMGYAKKPYRIKFNDKQNVFGLGKAKSWVLLADYLDPSALRNQVAFGLASRINTNTAETTGFKVFSPRMKLVEVYLNGEFQGLYEMGDHMQADKTRVNVSEWGDEDATAAGEDVGYFIEVEVKSRVLKEGADGYEDWSAYSYIVDVLPEGQWYPQKVDDGDVANNYVIREEDIGKSVIYFQFKLPEEPSDDQKSYITEQMQQVNNLLAQQDDAVWDILDMDSVIDWYLVNELFKNADSQMQSSVYFFKNGLKDSDGNPYENPNTKLYMGPVWDFDLGAGGVAYGSMDDPTGWRTSNNEYCAWFKNMFAMDSFKTAVEARWADLHEKGILEALFTDIAYLEEFAGDAAVDNFDLWHSTYLDEISGTWMEVPAVSTGSNEWETHVDYFEAYLKARIDWIDEQFGYSEDTVLQTKRESVDSLTYTAAVSGKQSQKYTIDLDVALDELGYILDMNSTAKWNVAFNYTVNATLNGKAVTFSLTPSTKDDWQAPDSSIFDGSTGAYHAAGNYTDRNFDITGALVWKMNNSGLGFSGITADNLSNYVNSIHFNYMTVQFESASAGDTATFSLKNEATDTTVLNIEKTVIVGKPSILGEAKPGMTLFVSNTEMLPYKASVTYQWYADGTAISGATGNSYKLSTNDLNKAITVKATATDAYTGTVTSDAKTVVKYQRTSTYKTSDIVLDSVTVDSITVSTIYDNVEFSLDGSNWQTSGTFNGLAANTVYMVYMRAAEHNTGAPGVACSPLVVTTPTDETFAGDINGSGKLDTTDATWVLDHALEFANMTNETVLALSDVNSDGKINTLDARLILKEIVNSTEI